MEKENFTSLEIASARNLMGVIFYSMKNYRNATTSLLAALESADEDPHLQSQIYLNLGSLYYKQNLLEKAFDVLGKIDVAYLKDKGRDTFYRLGFILGESLGKNELLARSLIGLLGNAKNIHELKSDVRFKILNTAYSKIDDRAKVRIYKEGKTHALMVVAYLSFLDAKRRYYAGNKKSALDILRWLKREVDSRYSEITGLVDHFLLRLENYSKMGLTSIGVILPLSGDKMVFGKRALFGIDSAFRTDPVSVGKYQIYPVDSQGSGAVGSYRVRELVENNQVSTIIGGLFPEEALEEYLEAKKYGVLFISLSQIYLSKDKKDHLLIEIPGSIESQMEVLFSSGFLNKFGHRGAIIYPQNIKGEAYIDEFWFNANQKEVDITGIQSYQEKQNDYRNPVRNILGIQFARERQEEYDILSEIYRLEKKHQVRRIQVLKPQVDFDWIFIPADPHEALQLIPSFSYYDAIGLNIIGVPAWRSQTLVKGRYSLTNLHFIGDDVSVVEDRFAKDFYRIYKKRLKIVELLGHDAFSLVKTLFNNVSLKTRDKLDEYLRTQTTLKGITGSWRFYKGVWLKNMALHSLRRGRISRISL